MSDTEQTTVLDRREGATFTSAIVDQIRQQVIDGHLAPDTKLRIRDLAARFGVGLSPIREALNRLTSEGLVRQIDLRGFSVAPVSVEELEELTRTAAWLNERALRESIAHGGPDWEEAVLLAFHRLTRQPRTLPDGSTLNPEWDVCHRLFHHRLIQACRSSWLIGYCDQLFDVTVRYRNLARTSRRADYEKGDKEHRSIMEATLARDPDAAVQQLLVHFRTILDLCRTELNRRLSAS